MPASAGQPLYENGLLTQAAGGTLHPGGLDLTAHLLEMASLTPGRTILDIGCGSGSTVQFLLHSFGLRAYGIDHCRALLQTGFAAHDELPLACASGLHLPFAARSLDAVLSECSLSATGNPEAVLAEISRILAPSGHLLLSDLYAREPQGLPFLQSLPLRSGLRYAKSQQDLYETLKEHTFEIVDWEDHSASLKNLTAHVSQTHGSLSTFWAAGEPDANPMDVILAASRARLGYYLLVARKPGS